MDNFELSTGNDCLLSTTLNLQQKIQSGSGTWSQVYVHMVLDAVRQRGSAAMDRRHVIKEGGADSTDAARNAGGIMLQGIDIAPLSPEIIVPAEI